MGVWLRESLEFFQFNVEKTFNINVRSELLFLVDLCEFTGNKLKISPRIFTRSRNNNQNKHLKMFSLQQGLIDIRIFV